MSSNQRIKFAPSGRPIRKSEALLLSAYAQRCASHFSPRPTGSSCGKLCVDAPRRCPMSSSLETLQAEVLRLPPADREKLLDRLIASLDVDASVEAAWDQLADQREKELATGAATAVPFEVAIARLEARFPG